MGDRAGQEQEILTKRHFLHLDGRTFSARLPAKQRQQDKTLTPLEKAEAEMGTSEQGLKVP